MGKKKEENLNNGIMEGKNTICMGCNQYSNTPILHHSSLPSLHHSILHNFNTSHINVMIAVATMIDTMLVTTAEVAA